MNIWKFIAIVTVLVTIFWLSGCTTEREKIVLLHFDEPFGSTFFADSSGNMHHGSCGKEGLCPTSGIRGRVGHAVGFNGANIFVDLGPIETGSSFSIEARIRPDSAPLAHEIIVLGMQEGRDVFALEFNEEKGLRIRFADDTNSSTDYSGYMRFGTKNHIIAVFDDTKNKVMVYVNGKKEVEGTYSDSMSIRGPVYLNIGGGLNHTSFRGVIDEFAIYNSALSEKNVRMLYDKTQMLDLEQFDEKPVINIKNERDVISKRANLVRYIWKDKGFPLSVPDVVKDINDDKYSFLSNLKRIDKLVVRMDYGLESIAYYFHPIESNNRLVIYHEGNGKDFSARRYTIGFFLDKGYSVLAFAMPLTGMNKKSENLSRLSDPSSLVVLKSETLSPIKYFLEPIAVVLNYALAESDYSSVAMIGFSGGGWVTTLYTAIDPRISKSYPIAGTLPFYIRDRGKDLGGLDNHLTDFYQIADYLELYTLGAYGRRQVQILNKYDSCCYAARGRMSYIKSYEEAIQKVVNESGGSFQVYIDDTNRHTISGLAREMIEKDIRDEGSGSFQVYITDNNRHTISNLAREMIAQE